VSIIFRNHLKATVRSVGRQRFRIRMAGSLVAILVCLGSNGVLSVAAGAGTPDLSTVLLADALPGMVVTPPGTYNGPVTQGTDQALSGPTGATLLNPYLANGTMSGYVRSWINQPPNGDTVNIFAFTLRSSSLAGTFFGGVNHGNSESADATVAVPTISGGFGFVKHLPLAGQPATEHVFTFARGNTVFEVQTASTSDDISPSDATSVASRQAAAAPGDVLLPIAYSVDRDSSLHLDYVLGEVLFYVLVAAAVIAVMVVVVRQRRKPPATAPSAYMAPYPGAPVSPPWGPAVPTQLQAVKAPSPVQPQATAFGLRLMTPVNPTVGAGPDRIDAATVRLAQQAPAPAGWYPDYRDSSRQRYFDGQVWTAHTAPR
jgi:hypothetical protein